jgi:hypothetical protein
MIKQEDFLLYIHHLRSFICCVFIFIYEYEIDRI